MTTCIKCRQEHDDADHKCFVWTTPNGMGRCAPPKFYDPAFNVMRRILLEDPQCPSNGPTDEMVWDALSIIERKGIEPAYYQDQSSGAPGCLLDVDGNVKIVVSHDEVIAAIKRRLGIADD